LPIHDIQLFHKLPERLNHVKNPIFHFWECKPVNNAYAATLAKSWSVYEKQLSKKIRNDSKRQLRRLSKHGNLQFLIAKTDKDYDRFSSAMIAQKRQRFQDTGARDILSNIYTQKFYSGLRGKIAKKGMVHLSVLLLDNNILSTHWGVVYGDRFYFLLPTFDSGLWSKYSTGRLLQEKIIKWSIDNDFKVFDFTIGGEQYKKTWCNQRMSIYSSEKLVSIFGLIYFILSKFAILLKTNLITRKYLMKINSKIMFLRKK